MTRLDSWSEALGAHLLLCCLSGRVVACFALSVVDDGDLCVVDLLCSICHFSDVISRILDFLINVVIYCVTDIASNSPL